MSLDPTEYGPKIDPRSIDLHLYFDWFKHILFNEKDLTKQNMQLQSSPKNTHAYNTFTHRTKSNKLKQSTVRRVCLTY